MTAHRRSDPISQWAAALRERSGWQKAVVALANKNARILWAVMTKGEAFDARHVSVKPGASDAGSRRRLSSHSLSSVQQSLTQQATSKKMQQQVRPAAGKLD